jgi:hypothetical protein
MNWIVFPLWLKVGGRNCLSVSQLVSRWSFGVLSLVAGSCSQVFTLILRSSFPFENISKCHIFNSVETQTHCRQYSMCRLSFEFLFVFLNGGMRVV